MKFVKVSELTMLEICIHRDTGVMSDRTFEFEARRKARRLRWLHAAVDAVASNA